MGENYYEKLNNTIKYLEDYSAELQQNYEDELEINYYKYFLNGFLNNEINEIIGRIKPWNIDILEEKTSFSFYIEETNYFNKDLNMVDLTFKKYAKDKNIYTISINNEIESLKTTDIVDHIVSALESKEYGIENIEVSDWESTEINPDNNRNEYLKLIQKVSFDCSIIKLIDFFYLESLRYSYLYDTSNYLKEGENYLKLKASHESFIDKNL